MTSPTKQASRLSPIQAGQSAENFHSTELRILCTGDGSRTLHSSYYGQTYHSMHGAEHEALHVFLEGTNIAKTLAQQQRASVLEVGFGVGLNFLLTATAAERHGATLHYTGLDRCIPDADTLAALDHGSVAGSCAVAEFLIAWRRHYGPDLPEGHYSLCLENDGLLELVIGEATQVLLPEKRYDAIYLDPFDPRRNPELWTLAFFRLLFAATKPGGVLATYSAAGAVRRGLIAAGFIVERCPGPPGKREYLTAQKPQVAGS